MKGAGAGVAVAVALTLALSSPGPQVPKAQDSAPSSRAGVASATCDAVASVRCRAERGARRQGRAPPPPNSPTLWARARARASWRPCAAPQHARTLHSGAESSSSCLRACGRELRQDNRWARFSTFKKRSCKTAKQNARSANCTLPGAARCTMRLSTSSGGDTDHAGALHPRVTRLTPAPH